MNYPAAELRGIKVTFCLINPDAEHRGILLIKDNRNQRISFLRAYTSLIAEFAYNTLVLAHASLTHMPLRFVPLACDKKHVR
jgi:hypothetical protein